MKNRLGFVSNSSSSSYVIRTNEFFYSVKEIALWMLEKMYEKTECLKMLDGCPDDVNITFKSTNEDTFIAKIGEYFLIKTCNNVEWELYELVTSDFPKDLLEVYGDDWFFNLPFMCEFYSLEHKIIGKRLSWREKNRFCPKCHEQYWIVNERLMCLDCERKYESKNLFCKQQF